MTRVLSKIGKNHFSCASVCTLFSDIPSARCGCYRCGCYYLVPQFCGFESHNFALSDYKQQHANGDARVMDSCSLKLSLIKSWERNFTAFISKYYLTLTKWSPVVDNSVWEFFGASPVHVLLPKEWTGFFSMITSQCYPLNFKIFWFYFFQYHLLTGQFSSNLNWHQLESSNVKIVNFKFKLQINTFIFYFFLETHGQFPLQREKVQINIVSLAWIEYGMALHCMKVKDPLNSSKMEWWMVMKSLNKLNQKSLIIKVFTFFKWFI